MQLIRGLINLKNKQAPCVATIGNFDGVHLGHQAIVNQVVTKAGELKVQSCVILFEPHPREFFSPEDSPARLTSFREKLIFLRTLGIDRVLVLRFNAYLSHLPAQDFISQILIDKLHVKHLVVGDDFHFGYQRQGNYQLLESMSDNYYTLEPTSTITQPNAQSDEQEVERVSSTLVREKLALHDLESASNLLGRNYSVCGKVVYGDQLGRTIGFPTANIAVKRKKLPLTGVFLVKASWTEEGIEQKSWGVANCGIRPTVNGRNYRIEVHLLGVRKNLYGIELTAEFVAGIRNEQKFENINELKRQIEQDVQQANKLIEDIESGKQNNE